MPYSDSPVLFKSGFIFKDFSRKPLIFKYFSSLCEPCFMSRRFNQRMNVLEWSHYIHPRAANSVVDGGVWPKFKLIQALMVVLVTCKNKDDPFKNEGAGVFLL